MSAAAASDESTARVYLPKIGTRFRLWSIALGIALLCWTALQDRDLVLVSALGCLTSFTAICWLLLSRFGGQAISQGRSAALAIAAGAGIGLGAALMTCTLMILKNGLQGRLIADFPPHLILALLERMPAWALAGGLIGFGASLLQRVLRATNRADCATMDKNS